MALISSPSSSTCNNCILVLLLCFLGFTSASTFLSDGIFHSSRSSTRTLLQTTKNCSVDFEHANYTGLINECNGPAYPRTPCCDAFKEFACPYSEELNDLNSDCAKKMFNNIYTYGNFPPGYFTTECQGDHDIECSTAADVAYETVNSTAHISANRATFLVAAVSMVSLSQIL